jgi:hypothetical protein
MVLEKMVLCLVISNITLRLWERLGFWSPGREAASVGEASKAIRLCKLPLMCNVELDVVASFNTMSEIVFD